MDELGFYVPSTVFQSFRDDGRVNMKGSVQWSRLGSRRISPPAGFEPVTPWTEVGSANRSATRTLHIWWTAEKSRTRVFYSQVSLPTRIISGQAKCDPVEQIGRVFEDNFRYFSIKHMLWVLTTYVFMENWPKLSRLMTKPTNDCAPSEDSAQPGHPPSLIRVFAVRLMSS